jgi:1-acyl-sn-glycerol-3-phosphate acyltransferase
MGTVTQTSLCLHICGLSLVSPKIGDVLFCLVASSIIKMGFLYYVTAYTLRILINVYYSTIKITGREQTPQSGPLVVVTNHFNLWMDGMALTGYTNRKVIWMSSAASFAKPVVGHVLKALE